MTISLPVTARAWSLVFLAAVSTKGQASCECNELDANARISRANYIFVGEVTSARIETVAEYEYYRLPGRRSWVSEEDISADARGAAELRISKDRVIWVRFSDIEFYKRGIESIREVRMGDSACQMNVMIGAVYLIYSVDGSYTGDCDGSANLSLLNKAERSSALETIERLIEQPPK